MNRRSWYYIHLILLLAFTCWLTGCVTIREAKRYGAAQHSLGVVEGISIGAEPWEKSYLECDKALDAALAAEARETDRKLRR